MRKTEFEKAVAEAFESLPEKFKKEVKNLAFIVENEPSREIRQSQELAEDETLLGLYTGIPLTARGDMYGMGPVMPDTIHIYQKPIEEEAEGNILRIKEVIKETVWHEVAHYFGYEEGAILKREEEGTNQARLESE